MIISIINHAYNTISDDDVQQAIRCINRQISEDFEPYWGFGGKLRLEGRTGKQPASDNPVDIERRWHYLLMGHCFTKRGRG